MAGILDDTPTQATDTGWSSAIDSNAQLPYNDRRMQAFGQNISPYLNEAILKDPSIFPQAPQISFGSVGNINGVQLPVFSSPAGTLPLRAMMLNQMSPPPPSVNQKLMGSVIDKLLKHPTTDPALQKQISNEWNHELLDGSLQEGLNTYGNRTYEILAGAPRTEGELQYMLDTRKKIEYLNDAANLGTTLGKRLEEAQKEKNVDPEYMQSLYDYQNTFRDKDTPFDEKVGKWEKDVSRIQTFDNLKDRMKQFLPNDDILNKTYTLKPAEGVDERGKPIHKLTLTTTDNDPSAIGFAADLGNRVQDMMDEDEKRGQTYGIDDRDERFNYLMRRAYYLLPHATEQKELSEGTKLNIKVGDEEDKTPFPAAPKPISFNFDGGKYQQNSQYSTAFEPIKIQLGSTVDGIKESTGITQPTTIGQDATVHGIVMLNVGLTNGNAFILDDKDVKNPQISKLQVPYVQVEVPKTKATSHIDPTTGATITDPPEYETVYVPLSQAQGTLEDAANKEKKSGGKMKATIQQYLGVADELNNPQNTSQDAINYYNEHFKSTDTQPQSQTTGGYHF